MWIMWITLRFYCGKLYELLLEVISKKFTIFAQNSVCFFGEILKPDRFAYEINAFGRSII